MPATAPAQFDKQADTVAPNGKHTARPTAPLRPLEPLAVDAAQAAALIGVSRSMFFKLADAGLIGPKGVHLGRCIRYPLAEFRAWAVAGMPPRHQWQQIRANSSLKP